MPLRPMCDEIDPRRGVFHAQHRARVDPLVPPQRVEQVAKHIRSRGTEKANPCTLPRGGNRRVRGVAAEALHIGAVRNRLVELDHRFAEKQYLHRTRHSLFVSRKIHHPLAFQSI